MEKERKEIWAGCRSCHINCGVKAIVENGRLEAVEGVGPDHNGFGKVCLRGLAAKQFVYSPTRVRYPMKRAGRRGEGKWERVSWDQAVDEIAVKIHEMCEKYGSETFVLPGRTGRHDMGWIAHRIARTIGTPNCYYGPIQVCLLPQFHSQVQFGSYTAQPNGNSGVELKVSTGSEAAYSWPVISGSQLMMMDRVGTKTIALDPVAGVLPQKSTLWLPIRPGTDLAWSLCVINHLITTNQYKADFVKRWTNAPFLVREDTGALLVEADVVKGGSTDRYLFWDQGSESLKWWDSDEVQWEGGESGRAHYDHLVELFNKYETTDEKSPAVMPEGMNPALFGTYKVRLALGGYEIECKPAFQLLADGVAEWTVERASEVTWVDADRIQQALDLVVESKTIEFYEGGQYMSTNTSQFLNANAILKMLTGNVDNVGAEMDHFYPVTPIAFPGEWDISYAEGLSLEQKRKRLGYYDRRIGCGFAFEEWVNWHPLRPENADALLCFPDIKAVLDAAETGRPYPVRGIIAISSNWLMHDPSTARWMRLLEDESKIELHVVTELVMTPTAEMADYVLPALTWVERNYMSFSVGGGVPYKNFFRKAVEPICEAKHDYDFGAMLAKRLEKIDPKYNYGLLNPGTSFFYAGEYGKLWEADTIDEERERWCTRFLEKPYEECLNEGRVFTKTYKPPKNFDPNNAAAARAAYAKVRDKYLIAGKFPTDTGKCNMFSTLHQHAGFPPLPVYEEPYESPISRPDLAEEYPLVLTTGKRQAGFFHSEFRQLPWMREINPVPEVFMNRETAAECGVDHGDWVWVESPETCGRAPMNKIMGRVSCRFQMLPGVVSYSQHAWWRPEKAADDDCHGAFEWNCEALLECDNSTPETGTMGLRSQLCKVYKATDADIEKYQPMITREQLEALMPVNAEEME